MHIDIGAHAARHALAAAADGEVFQRGEMMRARERRFPIYAISLRTGARHAALEISQEAMQCSAPTAPAFDTAVARHAPFSREAIYFLPPMAKR